MVADKSAIEWTDATWTPIRARNKVTGKVGWHCEHASEGCRFCYAEGFNLRLGTGLPFKPGHRDDIELFLDEEMLLQPLHWKKGRKIFVCSMTDLFADFVEDEWLDRMFAVMALAPQHTFQVLTKRAERMRAYFDGIPEEPHFPAARDALIEGSAQAIYANQTGEDPSMWLAVHPPLPNVWLGVSVERQEEADERIPALLDTPAAVRFLSCEPLLGPLNLAAVRYRDEKVRTVDRARRVPYVLTGRSLLDPDSHEPTEHLDWVIVGGESGPRARPFDLDWAYSILGQCKAAGVACFIKQIGSRPVWPVDLPYLTGEAMRDRKGGDPAEWPEDLRVRELPNV